MDMELASELLSLVCDRLKGLAIEEYVLLRNLKEEVKNLKSTASLIKKELHDAEEKEAKYEAVRVWLRQLKRILLDAEDILDEYATDARLHISYEDDPERKIKVRDIFCCFGYVKRILGDHDMARRIKAIRLKLDDKREQKNELGFQTSVARDVPKGYRPTRPPTGYLPGLDGSYFSGRDEEREKMIQVLLRLEEVVESNVCTIGVQVLVIHGVGGVGKTTLAQLIFNDPRVEEHFQLMMWVCVSEDFDLRRITREITEAALSSEEGRELLEISNWDVQQRRLKKKIEDKRFLLVLDDLWEEDSSKWERLCQPLVHGSKGSKIMVTTRKHKTLKMVNGIPFPLEVMSNKALWPIFRRYAFGNEKPSGRMQLENVGRQIVEKLKGLPLAAKVIGRLLNESLDMNYWTSILNSEIFTLQRDGILPILKLSYDHLFVNLKQCFAYCSLFPKDYIFSKDDLIPMWMAQNFIPNTGDLNAEQAGRESFNDLLNKSFFERSVKWSSNESFKMHDLMHDLAESISKDDCFRLGDDKQKQMFENVRHVSIATNSFDLSKFMEVLNRENLRTLVFLDQNGFQWTPPLDDLFVKLKRLRILGLRRCNIKQLPSSIGKLKHLRFVDLSFTLIRYLPDSMSDLHNMQVLKLKGCGLLALPRNTSALVNLRHLELDTEIASVVQGLRKLTALQELIVTGSKVGELADMSMLKDLRIRYLEGVASKEEAIRARLEAKKHLELLDLKWSREDWLRQQLVSEEEVVDALKPVNGVQQISFRNYEGVRSPKWMGDPSWVSTSLLEKLDLRGCRKWEVLPPLGQLPGLKFLILSGMSGVRRIGPEFFSFCDDGRGGGGVNLWLGFPSLEELVFDYMPEWEEWESPPVVELQQHPLLFFPRLHRLKLHNCRNLRELPPLPPTLTTLKKVELRYCAKWEVMPPLGQLPGLKFLIISGMSGVRRIGPEFFGLCDDGRGGGGGTPDVFPSLEELVFESSPEWEEWVSPPVVEQQQHPSMFLPRLCTLELRHCLKLRELPPLPPTLTSLFLDNVGMTHLPGWMTPPASSSSSPSLSSFKIRWCPNLTSLDDGLLQRPLRMLKELTIIGCEELASLPDGLFRHLGSLEQLEVADCPKLSWPPPAATEEDALLPSSLKDVRLRGCGDLTGELLLLLLLGGGLPKKLTSLSRLNVDVSFSANLAGLGALTSLTHLDIVGDDHVDEEALLACLQGLTSLKSLNIRNCSATTTLTPLRCLSALEGLTIVNCAELRSLGCSALVSIGELTIERCAELRSLGCSALVSIRRLQISDCAELRSLGCSALVSIGRLSIRDCAELRSLGCSALVSIRELSISTCPKLLCLVEGGVSSSSSAPSQIIPSTVAKIPVVKTLTTRNCSPEQIATWLRQVSSLQQLEIRWCSWDGIDRGDLEGALLDLAPSLRTLWLHDCENLSSLPSNLRGLSCLERLLVHDCPKIERLPPAGLPETLESLSIVHCPELEQRCREEGCPDWPLLSHVPTVRIGNRS